MIRINLLGQPRPKARRGAAVPMEATRQILLFAIVVGIAIVLVGLDYFNTSSRITDEQEKIKTLTAQKTELEGLKKQVEDYEKRKQVLEQRIKVIEDLRRNKTGGQELLDMVATTVTRTDALWLTSLVRRGNGLTMEGSAASINAVANFITQLKRSGYFDKVEIRESRQDEKAGLLPTFFFTLTAEFVLPQSQAPAAAPRKS